MQFQAVRTHPFVMFAYIYLKYNDSRKSCIPLRLSHHHASVGVTKMAETYVIPMGDIPSRKLRKTVKVFIKEEDVCLYDDGGQEFGVSLEKNRLILKPDQ